MQYDQQVQQQMFTMITSWQRSGLSQKAYCEHNHIRYHLFHYWYKRYKHAQAAHEDGFVALSVKPAVTHAAIEVLLADGKRILFHQPVTSDFLKALIS